MFELPPEDYKKLSLYWKIFSEQHDRMSKRMIKAIHDRTERILKDSKLFGEAERCICGNKFKRSEKALNSLCQACSILNRVRGYNKIINDDKS